MTSGTTDRRRTTKAMAPIMVPSNLPATTLRHYRRRMKSMDGNPRARSQIATYSSRGPSRLDLVLKPDLVAPGNRVISLNTNNSYLDEQLRQHQPDPVFAITARQRD